MNISSIDRLLILAGVMAVALILASERVVADGLIVVQAQPAPRSVTTPPDASIHIRFDKPIDRTTISHNTFSSFGRWSGPVEGTFAFSDGDQTVTLTPATPFSAGEQVLVTLSDQIKAADGASLPAGGFSFQFWTQAAASELPFETLDTLSTRTVFSETTRAYGGVATDFNNDGWLDLTIVNEDTADVRVFLNQADGSGRFHAFSQPTFPVNERASPSEAADFNKDGHADLAVVNINADSVSILLGNGDGTFAPQQEVPVGPTPRGIAVLDAEGDGDIDIVNTNSGGSGTLSLLLNNGSGVFALPTFFEGGGNNEWALAAADMNEDGRLDLVVGARDNNTPTIVINTGNGDGTFSFLSSQSAGGAVWMVNTGDLNKDGHDDVVAVNSNSDNGAILLGDGQGNLAAPTLVETDPFALATDLGDVDGDGDLDWVTSSFFGAWLLFTNDGLGNFTLRHTFPSPAAASCALLLDFDNNGSLDLALIDEVTDEVILVRNRPIELVEPIEHLYLPLLTKDD